MTLSLQFSTVEYFSRTMEERLRPLLLIKPTLTTKETYDLQDTLYVLILGVHDHLEY